MIKTILLLLVTTQVFAQETHKEYLVYRVWLSKFSYTMLESGSKRIKEGMIVESQSETFNGKIISNIYGMGTKDIKLFIAIRMRGYDRTIMNALKQENERVIDSNNSITYDERRFMVKFEDLKILYPSFDLNRARDLNDPYQPFRITKDLSSGRGHGHIADDPIFDVDSVVWDLKTRQYFNGEL